MKWNTLTFVAIGALAAFYVVLSAPGAILAAVMANPMFSAIGNLIIIGIAYALVALLIQRVGAVTLWALVVGMLFIPLPLAGPPGALIKVVILGSAGLLADIIYLIFRKSDKIAAVVIGSTQVGSTVIWVAPVLGVTNVVAG